MAFYPFEVTIPHIIYACLGGFVVLFGMFSLFLRERLYISEACWSFLFGIIIGPYCADIFNPRAWSGNSEEVTNVITLEFTRVVLAIGVFAIGVELPKAYMARHWRSLFFLLVPVMTWGWLVSAAFIYALIPGLNFLSSLAVAACLTPTDPILAAAVIGGKWADKHVPAHIRHLLAAESGCNDGAAFPFLFLALYLLLDAPDTKAAIKDWFLLLWLYQILVGALIGCILGFGFRHLMKFCERMDLIDRHSYVAQYVSLAMFTIGVTTLLGSDDLLAAFFCGTAFAWDGFFNRQTEESVFSSVIDLLFNVAAFIFVGAWMPFNKFQDAQLTLSVWRLIVIGILVLLFRRLPIMIALYRWIPDVKNFREAVFSGHFGPIGIGAIFISTLAIEVIHNAHKTAENSPNFHQLELLTNTIQPIVAFMVLCSILIHGLSIPSFSLGRRVHSVSRTWSRHATMTSGGLMQPEWTNQTQIVDRGAAGIVINRDRADIDIERGLGMISEKFKEGTDSEETKDEFQGHVEIKVDGNAPVEIKVDGNAPVAQEVHFADENQQGDERGSSVDLSQSMSATLTSQHPRTPERVYTPKRVQSLPSETPLVMSPTSSTSDYRQEPIPDGGHLHQSGEGDEITEWREGDQRVIERRMGPGDDVEVTVIHDPLPPGSHPVREAMYDLERSLSKDMMTVAAGISHAGKRARDAISSPKIVRTDSGGPGTQMTIAMRRRRSDSGSKKRQEAPSASTSNAVNAKSDGRLVGTGSSTPAVAWDDEDEGWASEGSNGGEPSGSSLRGGAEGKKRPRMTHILKNFARRRRGTGTSFRRGGGGSPTAADGEDNDEPRGRDRDAAIKHSHGHGKHHQQSRSSGSVVTASGIASGNSRPGTATNSIRHHRLDRLMHEHPQTRETSPARSVRFVDLDLSSIALSGGRGSGVRTPRSGGAETPNRVGGAETPPTGGLGREESGNTLVEGSGAAAGR